MIENKLKCNTNLDILILATLPRQGIVYKVDFNSVFIAHIIKLRFTGISTLN